MPKIFSYEQIVEALKRVDVVPAIEEGFIAYSRGMAVVPPVGELTFEDPPGDCHIKYGYIKGDDYYVIKIAAGVYDSDKVSVASFSGMMLVFSLKTGRPVAFLMDDAHLTNVRTAAAGAIAAKYMAPKNVLKIGMMGTGIQGKIQLEFLKPIVDCREVLAFDINKEYLEAYKEKMEPLGFNIRTTMDPAEVAAECNLIVTVTPATSPLLMADQIRKGTHISALGSDTPEKQELDAGILQMADIVVADSKSQCLLRGEINHAIKQGKLKIEDAVELGDVIINPALRRQTDDQITVADLTGVAVQDIQISKAVLNVLNS